MVMYPCITCMLWYNLLYFLVQGGCCSGISPLYSSTPHILWYIYLLCLYNLVLSCTLSCILVLLVYSGTRCYIFLYTITVTLVHLWYAQVCSGMPCIFWYICLTFLYDSCILLYTVHVLSCGARIYSSTWCRL